MKGLIVFVALVLSFATINCFQVKVQASSMNKGIETFLKHNGHSETVKRSPAIVNNK